MICAKKRASTFKSALLLNALVHVWCITIDYIAPYILYVHGAIHVFRHMYSSYVFRHIYLCILSYLSYLFMYFVIPLRYAYAPAAKLQPFLLCINTLHANRHSPKKSTCTSLVSLLFAGLGQETLRARATAVGCVALDRVLVHLRRGRCVRVVCVCCCVCCVVSCRVVSCRVVSCRVVSCCVVLCRVVSCCVVLCCVRALMRACACFVYVPACMCASVHACVLSVRVGGASTPVFMHAQMLET